MSYLTIEELKSAIYEYQMDEITEGDDTIVLAAIEAAIDEVKSYLTPNRQRNWYDGRILYDANAVFAAEGNDRNPLILALTKTIAKWWIILLANPDIIYEQVKERYDRAVEYLNNLAIGKVSISSLPKKPTQTLPPDNFIGAHGSRRKFHHEDSSGYYGCDDNPFYSPIESA